MSNCNNKKLYNCTDCVDAWELSRTYTCNESPKPISNLYDVDVGDLVEINQNGERFWVKILEICSCHYIVEVVSDLVFQHPFSKGDKIRIEIYHIYNVKRS